MQDVSNNSTKKPVASVGLYLPKRILHLLRQSDSETDSKTRLKLAQLALDFAAPFRKQAGFGGWEWIAAATCSVVVLTLWLHAHWPKTYFYSYPSDYLRITAKLNDSDYMVQRVEDGKPLDVTMMRFCPESLRWLWVEQGHTFSWIRYDDHGSCAQIAPDNRGFDVVRRNGIPVLPPNCRVDWSVPKGRVVCEGGMPRWE